MSGASNFSFIHPRSFKAGKLGDKANSLNSSDESIFTLNVDEDKHSSDLSSAEYHMEKKKKKRIKLEQCDEDGIQVRLYDSPEEPMKKKKKKNKCRIVEELSMEDSVDLNNICLNDMNNLECSSSGDSPKKKHKKKQCEGNAEEALVSDPHVTLENVMSKKKKKKKKEKKKEKVKESEVSEYSKDDKFCDSNIALEEVVRKKKNKEKNHDGENSVSKIVHLEYSYGEQNQESLSSARKKKKKRPADDTELDDVGGESTKQHDVESENDNSKKKRKRSPESKKMKERQNNSIEIFGQVSEEEVKIEIVEENLEANHGSLKKKKKKRNAMTKEEDAMEIEHQEDVCDGQEAQHFNSSNKRKKKKHKKKNDENAEAGFADVEEDCTIQDSLRFENDVTSKKRKSSTKPTKKEKRKNNSCDNYFEQVTEEEIADQEECDKQQTKHLDSPNKKQKKNQKTKCDGNIEDESFSENGEQISANIEADGADDSTQEEDSKIEIVVENLDFSKNEKRKDDVEMEEVDGMKSEHQEDEEHDDRETQQSDSFGNKQTKKQHQKEGDGNSDDFFNVENVKPQEPPLMRPAKAAESMRKQKIESFDVDVDDLFDKSMEEQFLRKDQVAVLDNLCVRVPFEIPPLHLIETQIIKALTPSEKTMIANLDLTVKTGAYNKNEDEQIKNNWEQFCQHHHLNKDEPYLFTRFKHRNAKVLPASERFKFLRFLAHGMPDRLLSSVYRRFQRNFRTKTLTTGRYTEAEDKIILDYMKTHTGQVYLELGQILNRDRYSVESRYKKLTSEKATVTWSDDLSKKLVNTLQKCCGVSKSELEYWDISPEEWKQVEEEMEIPLRILKRTWLHGVYVKLFIDGEIDSKDIRQDMIETMYESGADDWKTVNWSQIAGRYKGFTPERICKIYKDIVAVHVPKKLHTDFRKSAVHLREQVLKDPDGYLRKRIYKKLPFK